MFLCTDKEEKRELLLNKGFKMLFSQNVGNKKIYAFELRPTLYATFNENDRDGIFLSNKMYMV